MHAGSSICASPESALRLDWTKLGDLRWWYIVVHPHGPSAVSAYVNVYSKADFGKDDCVRSQAVYGWLWQNHTVDSGFD